MVGGIALGVSVATWMFSMAKSMRPDEVHLSIAAAAVIQSGTVAVLSALFSNRSALIGPLMGLTPLILAGYTFPRGDDDGLWALVFLPLLFWTGLLVLLSGAIATAFRTRATWKGIAIRTPSRSMTATALVIAVAMGALSLFVRWPNPWSSLEAAHQKLVIPSEFQLLKSEHAGSPLSMYAPALVVWYRYNVVPDEACSLLRRSSQVHQAANQGFTCTFEGELQTGGGRIDRAKIRLSVGGFNGLADSHLGLGVSESSPTLTLINLSVISVMVTPTEWSED